MENKQNAQHRFWAVRYVILIALFALVVFFFLTDYSNVAIILLSFIGAIFISFFWGSLLRLIKRFRWWWTIVLAILLVVCLVVSIGLFTPLRMLGPPINANVEATLIIPDTGACPQQPPQYNVEMKSYDVIIEPVKTDNKISGTFKITDIFRYDIFEKKWDEGACEYTNWIMLEEDGVTQTNRSVESEELSLLSHKVEVNVSEYVEILTPDEKIIRAYLCKNSSCVDTTVSLEEMPLGSIGEVQYGTLTEGPVNEIDIQRAKWKSTNISRGIQFSFVPYPFHLVRKVIDPILDIKSIPSFVMAFVSAIGGIVVKPVLEDISKNKFRAWIEKRRKDKESNSAFL